MHAGDRIERPPRARRLALLVWCLVGSFGCDTIAPLRPPGPDAAIPEGCEDVTPAARVFASNCAVSGACHVPGGQFPDLSRQGLASLIGAESEISPGEILVVP